MVRKDIFVLDRLFDSPIITPTLSGFEILSNVPASTLAEHILNDPEAWGVLGDEIEPQPNFPLDEQEMSEQFTWLEKELRSINMRATTTAMKELSTAPTLDTDENITMPPSPASPQGNDYATYCQQTTNFGRAQQEKRKCITKAGQIIGFSPYIRDPPGGLGAPSHSLPKKVPPIPPVHLNPEKQNGGFTKFPEGVTNHEKPMSPPASEVSASPTSRSNTPYKIHPLPYFDSLKSRDYFLSEPIATPSVAATEDAPRFEVNPASTTSSFLEWYDLPLESPPVKISATGNDQASSPGEAAPSLTTLMSHPPTQSCSLTQSVIAGNIEDSQNNDLHDTAKMASVGIMNQQNHPGQTGSQSQGAPGPDADASTLLSPKKQSQKVPGHEQSGISGRIIAMHNSPTKANSSTLVLARGSPKPPPVTPIPAIPSDEPPPVPPKEVFREHPGVTSCHIYKANAKGKAPLRRLPSIPKINNSAIPKTGFEYSSGSHLPVVDTPPPALQRTNSSTPCHSRNPSESPSRTPRNGARAPCTRLNFTTTSSIDTSLAAVRTAPCPAGPRKRGPSLTTTPIKSSQWSPSHASSNSVPMISTVTGVHTNSPIPPAVSRSISAPYRIPQSG